MSQTHIPAELRRFVRERAGDRCEYCLIPQSAAFAAHEVDHIIAEKHGGETTKNNLAMSCILCNRRKGTDLTSIDNMTGDIVRLYDPRNDKWQEHFQIVESRIEGLTPNGRVSVQLLQFNQTDRVEERQILLKVGAFVLPSP